MTEAFQTAVQDEIRRKRLNGRAYSITTADGRLVFIHPDGSIRLGRDSASPLAS